MAGPKASKAENLPGMQESSVERSQGSSRASDGSNSMSEPKPNTPEDWFLELMDRIMDKAAENMGGGARIRRVVPEPKRENRQ